MDEEAYVSPKACWDAVNDKTFTTEDYAMTDLQLGVQRSQQFFSHGHRDDEGKCLSTTFVRRGKQYTHSYEKTRADFIVKMIPAHTVAGVKADQGGDDILLPDGLRLPASKLAYTTTALGTMVWNYHAAGCDPTATTKSVTQLYKGPMQIRRKLQAPEGNPLMGALLTVYPQADPTKTLEKAFGLALKFHSSVCGLQAHQTNLEDTFVIMLREGDKGVDTNALSIPSDPHVVALATQNSLLHISTNLRIDDMHQSFYAQICKNERRGLLNMLQNIRTSDDADILAPVFGRGHMILKAGSVAHIIECTPLDVQLDLNYKKCAQDIPVLKPSGNNTPTQMFMHPISRILTPTSAELPCSAKFPQIFRLDDGHHVCNTGAGMARCLTPTIIQPDSNGIPVSQWIDFSRAMSIGILSQPEINALSMKLHHHAYIHHMEQKQLWQNYENGNVGPRSDMSFSLDPRQLIALKSAIAAQFVPFFAFMGEYYIIFFGLFVCAMTISYCIGTCKRIHAEYTLAGCGPWLCLAVVGNLWNLWRLPLSMIKGASNAAQAQASHGSAGDLVVAAKIDHFNSRLDKIEAHNNGNLHTASKTNYATMDDFESSIDGTAPCTDGPRITIGSRAVAPTTLTDVRFNA